MVGEVHRAVEACVRRVRERAVGIDHKGTVGRSRHTIHHGPGEHVAIDIAIVRAQVVGKGCTLGHGIHIVHRNGRIVRRRYHNGDHRRIARSVGVAHLIREAHRAIEVRVRHIAEAAVGAHGECSVRRCATTVHHAPCELAAGVVHIAVIACYTIAQGGVLVHSERIIVGHGRIVARCYGDGHGSGITKRLSIAGLVGEAHRAIEVRARRVGECAVRVEDQRAVRCRRTAVHKAPRERTINIAVVACYAVCERSIFGQREAVVVGYWRIVQRVHGDGNGCYAAGIEGIARFISEGDRAVEVRVRQVGEGAIRVEHECAVRGCRCAIHQGEDQWVAVGIAVVGGHGVGERTILVHGEGVVHHIRCIVHTAHVDRDGRRVARIARIAHLVGEGDRAVEARIGDVREGAVRVQHDRAVRIGSAAVHNTPRELCATIIHIAVVSRNIAAQRTIFAHTEAIVHSHWRIVDRVHGDGHGGVVAEVARVAGHVGEAHRAIEVRVRCVGVAAVAVQHQGAVHRCGSPADQRPCERVAIRIAVATRHGGVQRAFFVDREDVISGDRGIVVAAHVNGYHRLIAQRAGVAHLVGEGDNAIEARVGNIGEGSIRVQCECAIGSSTTTGYKAPGELCVGVVDVAVVAAHVVGEGAVLDHAVRIVQRNRAVIHGLHVQRYLRVVAQAISVA